MYLSTHTQMRRSLLVLETPRVSQLNLYSEIAYKCILQNFVFSCYAKRFTFTDLSVERNSLCPLTF